MSYKILVLDDHEHYRRTYEDWSRKAGYEVTVQKSEDYSGLDSFPDLVIQDGNVTQGEDGKSLKGNLDLTRRLVKDIQKSGESISVLVVSIFVGDDDSRDFMEVLRPLGDGKFDYQPRQVSFDGFVKQVQGMLKSP